MAREDKPRLDQAGVAVFVEHGVPLAALERAERKINLVYEPQTALFNAKSPGRSQGPNTGLFLTLTGDALHVAPACGTQWYVEPWKN